MQMRVKLGLVLIILLLSLSAVGFISETEGKVIRERLVQLKDANSLDSLVEAASESKLTLLGESTHGTSEYYTWRAMLSQRLLEEQDYTFVVVEGDWPSFFQINLYIKGLVHQDRTAVSLLKEYFNRWPEWMWANEETAEFIEWLREFNRNRDDESKIGIYGMDIYAKAESIRELRRYFTALEEERFRDIAANYDCFTRFNYEGNNYARSIMQGNRGCAEETRRVVEFLRENRESLREVSELNYFNAKQNAIAVKNAEKHFRAAISRGSESWNERVFHFEQTVNRLLDEYGENAKGIVWAHNTHIGDARATSMSLQGSYNIGQLARENIGYDKVFSVGFACFEGEVLAGESWGADVQTMTIPKAHPQSLEFRLNELGAENFIYLFSDQDRDIKLFSEPQQHRAIGVTYNPHNEYQGNYVPTVMLARYNAFVFFNETTPLKKLE